MKTIFLGTSWESVEALKLLVNDPYFDVMCVITASDKPVGRKQVMTQSEVKSFALEKNIPVVHTENNKKKYMEVLDKYKPDIAVCKAFGEIIPKEFLDYPKYGCINIHFSILPKYRGAVPIQKAILEGEKETGISIMLMTEGLDEGPILEIFKEKIEKEDTNITLRKRLVQKTTNILIPTLRKWIAGDIQAVPQNDLKATYCWQKDISKENAEILWNKYEPKYIERMIRALLPWPIAWTVWNEKRLQIFDAEIITCQKNGNPGDLIVKEGLILFKTKLKDKCISVKELRLEGKKRMTSAEALRGKTLLK
jgi:methionyl-tRNA formyltransferase